MDEQDARGRGDAGARLQVALERLDEVRAAAGVVVAQALDRLAVAVARGGVRRDVDEVAVRAEVGVGERAAGRGEPARDPRRVAGLAQREAALAGAAAHRADADRHSLARAQGVERTEDRGRARCRLASGSTARSRSRPGSQNAPGAHAPQRGLEALGRLGPRPRCLADGLGDDQHVRALEIAAGHPGARRRDLAAARGERLEEVAHEVLRGQALDQLGLLERERELPGDRVEQELGLRPGRRRDAEHADRLRARPQLDRRHAPERGGRAGRVGGDQLEPAAAGLVQVQLAALASEHLAQPAAGDAVEVLAPAHRRDLAADPRERGQRVHAPACLLVEPRVLDRARDQSGRRARGRSARPRRTRAARPCAARARRARRPSAPAPARRPSTGSAPPRARARSSCADRRARSRG